MSKWELRDDEAVTPSKIRARLSVIAKLDPESAHSYLDEMMFQVFGAIAEGRCRHPKACARAMLKAEQDVIDKACWWAYS